MKLCFFTQNAVSRLSVLPVGPKSFTVMKNHLICRDIHGE